VDEANSPTWDDIDSTGAISWDNLFSSDQAVVVSMKIKWGDAADALTNEASMMEILTTVATGRYFQFEITITDPDPNIYALVDDVEFALNT